MTNEKLCLSIQRGLIRILDLIGDPNHWCQGDYGLTKQGEKLTANDLTMNVRADKLCLIGAALKCSGSNFNDGRNAEIFLTSIAKELNWENAEDFNDSTDHGKVIKFLLALLSVDPALYDYEHTQTLVKILTQRGFSNA